MTNIKPLGSLILIKEHTLEEKTTKSGLLITTSALEFDLKRGEVIAIGYGDHDNAGNHHPIPLEIGDVVIYSDNHTTDIEDDSGEKYKFINWRQLFGMVENNG
jgi:co-chaperonin GroES (HSP10)